MASVNFSTTFSLNTNPAKFIFNDTSDYAGQGISLSDVNGCFEITTPSGVVIYNNTDFSNSNCDIHISNSLTSQQTIPLPALGNGYPQAGKYTITYKVFNSALSVTYTKTLEFTFNYKKPTAKITSEADVIAPLFVTTDETNYTVNGITPTIDREMILQFPEGSGASPITNTTTATIVTSTFYTGAQVTTINNDVTYVFSDGLIVVDTVTGAKEITVDASLLCDVFCCVNSLNTKLEKYRNTNQAMFNSTLNIFLQVGSKVALLREAVDCGKQESVNKLINEIRTLADCEEDCGCTDGAPRLVTGLGAINVNVDVVSGGTPVIVTSATEGGITTYTVTLDSNFVTTALAGNSNITVGSTVFLDSTVGDDETGLAERLDKPFKTYAAARAVAVMMLPAGNGGIWIKCLGAGKYDEEIVLASGVHVDFGNSQVLNSGDGNTITDNNASCFCYIKNVADMQGSINIQNSGTYLELNVSDYTSASWGNKGFLVLNTHSIAGNADFITDGNGTTINSAHIAGSYIPIVGKFKNTSGATTLNNCSIQNSGDDAPVITIEGGTVICNNTNIDGSQSYVPVKVTASSSRFEMNGGKIKSGITSGKECIAIAPSGGNATSVKTVLRSAELLSNSRGTCITTIDTTAGRTVVHSYYSVANKPQAIGISIRGTLQVIPSLI